MRYIAWELEKMAVAGSGIIKSSFPFRPSFVFCARKARRSSSAAVETVSEPAAVTKEKKHDPFTYSRRGEDLNAKEWKKLTAKELGIKPSMIAKPTRVVLQGLKEKGFKTVNEAEMIALQIGLREPDKLGVKNFIMEGDSLCAIRWASGSSNRPSA